MTPTLFLRCLTVILKIATSAYNLRISWACWKALLMPNNCSSLSKSSRGPNHLCLHVTNSTKVWQTHTTTLSQKSHLTPPSPFICFFFLFFVYNYKVLLLPKNKKENNYKHRLTTVVWFIKKSFNWLLISCKTPCL